MRSLAKARFAHVGKYWKKGRIQFLFNGFHAGSIILHIGKVKYKLIMRMGGDLFELELYHKIIKKCPVLRDLWKTTFEYTLQKFYWLHVIPNSKSVLENHKKFTDVVRFFQFILSCIIMYDCTLQFSSF